MTRPRGTWRDYLALTRPSHWVKHIFIVPGVALAALLQDAPPSGLVASLVLGFASAAAIASANYVLNEWLDAGSDAHHPSKSARPAVAKQLSSALVWLEYLLLLATGLALASRVSTLFVLASLAFVASGLLYNLRPFRFKDRAVLDVVAEAINNPIRLTLGWAIVDGSTLPPSSLVLSYWMGGAFLMTVKRLAERRTVLERADQSALTQYRPSFAAYSEAVLLIQAQTCAVLASFLLAVFLVKYRIEYLLSVPIFVALFGRYLALGLQSGSAAESPERLFRDTWLVGLVAALVVALVVLTGWDLPLLDRLSDPHYIEIDLD